MPNLGVFRVDPGLTFARSGKAFWDFTQSTNYELDPIRDNVIDLTGNGNDLVPQSGAIWTRTNLGVHSVSGFTPPGYLNTYDMVNSLKLLASKVKLLFNSDWEMFLLMQQRAVGGGYMFVTDASTHFIKIYQSGQQMVVAQASGGSQTIASPTGFFDTSSVGTMLLRIRRVNGVSLNIYKNGVDFPISVTGATQNHSTFNPNLDWYPGIYNLNGVKSGTQISRDQNYFMMAITGLASNQQANNIQNWMYSRWQRRF